jgi:hypothetical protein
VNLDGADRVHHHAKIDTHGRHLTWEKNQS